MTLCDELTRHLRPLIDKGELVLCEDTKYVGLIERKFPFLGSKIEWSKVANAVVEQAPTDSAVDGCLRFASKMLKEARISDDQLVAVIGDGVMDAAFILSAKQMMGVLSEIVSQPQHTYIVSLAGEWCMVFSMEGDMAFGFAP